jgi:hypothetical protein
VIVTEAIPRRHRRNGVREGAGIRRVRGELVT